MARDDNTYSRIVGALKLALVLGALALLSTLFLLARGRDSGDVLPYSDADLAELLREPRVTAPEYTGLTRDGTAILLTAETARPANGNGATSAQALGVRLLLVTEGGGRTDTRADEVRINRGAGVMLLTGAVRAETSSGYVIEANRLIAGLDQMRLESPEPVTATGPAGRIEAGALLIDRNDPATSDVVVFKGGVRLLYHPANPSQNP